MKSNQKKTVRWHIYNNEKNIERVRKWIINKSESPHSYSEDLGKISITYVAKCPICFEVFLGLKHREICMVCNYCVKMKDAMIKYFEPKEA